MASEIMTKLTDAVQKLLNSPFIGIIYAISSTLFFSYNYFAAQEVLRLQKDFPVFEIVLMRCVIQLILILPYILKKKIPMTFAKDKWVFLLQLTVINYLIMALGYVVLIFIPSSLMLPISATCPLFAILFSVLILKKRFVWLDAVCGLIALIGVLFIARPKLIFGVYGRKDNSVHDMKVIVVEKNELNFTVGCLLAILFGAIKALFFTLVKGYSIIATDFSPLIFYPSLLGIAVTPMIMLLRGHVFVLTKTPYLTYCLIVASVFTLLGTLSNMIALKTQSPTVVSIIRNLDILWGFLLQFSILGVWPSLWSVGGSILIILTTIVVCLRSNILDRANNLDNKEELAQLNKDDGEQN